MFGNQKEEQPQQVQGDSRYNYPPPVQQQQGGQQDDSLANMSAISAEMNRLNEEIGRLDTTNSDIANYLQEQVHLTTEVASRVEKLEGKASSQLNSMSDDRRLSIIEQNLLVQQTTMEAIVQSHTELLTQFNKLIEQLGSTSSKKKKVKKSRKVEEPEDDDDDFLE